MTFEDNVEKLRAWCADIGREIESEFGDDGGRAAGETAREPLALLDAVLSEHNSLRDAALRLRKADEERAWDWYPTAHDAAFKANEAEWSAAWDAIDEALGEGPA